jgi:hypothetical protein
MTNAAEVIRQAELVLPGSKAPDAVVNPRWQAIIAVADYVASEPEAVWKFVCRWAEYDDDDLKMALGTCLLEHLLEHHFETYFDRVEQACGQSQQFARVFATCWGFGDTKQPENAARFDRLKKRVLDLDAGNQ